MAARLLTGMNIFDHITPVLKSLHWLPVLKRIDFKVLLLVYRALHDHAGEYMRDMLQEGANIQTLSSAISSQLAVPWGRLKGFEDHAFSIASPRLGNALPGSITDHKSICALSKSHKTHLFKSACY